MNIMSFRSFWHFFADGIRQGLQHIMLAGLHFTIMPLPQSIRRKLPSSPSAGRASIRYLPLIGIFVGCVAATSYAIGFVLFQSYEMAALTAVAVPVILTGAFHERGLAQFFSSMTRPAIPEPAASVGTVALILVIGAKYLTIMHIGWPLVPFALVAGHAFSRMCAAAFVFARPGKSDAATFMILTIFGMLPVVLLGHALFLLLLPILWLVRAALGYWTTKKLGDYTSSSLDTVQQLIELGFYIGVAIILRFQPMS